MSSAPEPTDSNPYLATAVSDRVVDPRQSVKPGPLSIVLSVFAGLFVAVVVFAATFFFTCLGLSSSQTLDNEFGFVTLVLVSGVTAIAAFLFTLWGLLKLVRAFKQ